MRIPTPDDVRAAGWAVREVRSARRQLAGGRVDQVRLRRPPAVGPRARRAVSQVLRAARCTCLERALVFQAWFAAHGAQRDVVIGVTDPRDFAAHAWLDGQAPCHGTQFHELVRLPPP